MFAWGKNKKRKRVGGIAGNSCGRMAFNGGELIDQVVLNICAVYHEQLHNQPVIYISNAIWGIGTANKLDDIQISINQLVEPVLKTWLDAVDADFLGDEQGYAIEYALRGWILARVLYTVERMVKYQRDTNSQQATKQVLFYQ